MVLPRIPSLRSTRKTLKSSKGKELLAEATSDGLLFLLDIGSLGGADHNTPLLMTPVSSGSRTSLVPDALATWGGRKGHPIGSWRRRRAVASAWL